MYLGENKQSYWPILLLLVISIISFAFVMVLFRAKEIEKDARIELRNQAEEYRTAKEDAEKMVEELNQEKAALRLSLDEKIKSSKELEEKLAVQKEKSRKLSRDLTEQALKIEKMAAYIKEKKELLARAEQIEKERKDLVSQLDKLREEKQQLEEKLKNYQTLEAKLEEWTGEEGVGLGNIILRAKKLEGRILAVNKKFDFVILDIGKKDFLMEGTILIIYRDKKFIGKIKVKKVYAKMSQGIILPGWTRGRIREGDKVRKLQQ